MADVHVRSDSRRRSTRVVLKIVILVEGVTEPLMCDGVTLVVNRHGALISAGVPLRHELRIKIQVVLTGMRAYAKVVHIDPDRPQVCGIALEEPENIWDLPSPLDDWRKQASESRSLECPPGNMILEAKVVRKHIVCETPQSGA